MPSAAGIIVATGIMTIANEMIQDNMGNLATTDTALIDNIPWRVIPATAIAAGIFYGIEQINSGVATGLAALAFVTAFITSSHASTNPNTYSHSSPLGTLLKLVGDKSTGEHFNTY